MLILASETKKAENGTRPFRVVLRRLGEDEIVVHYQGQDERKDYWTGSYFRGYEIPRAMAEFVQRCEKHGICVLNPDLWVAIDALHDLSENSL